MKHTTLLAGLLCLLAFTSCGTDTSEEATTKDTSTTEVSTNTSDSAMHSDSSTMESEAILDEASTANALEERRQLENDLKNAQKMLEEAKNMDPLTERDSIEAHIVEVKDIADSLREIDDFFIEATDLDSSADELTDKMNSFVQVNELPTFIDLGSKFNDISIKAIEREGSNIYAIGETGIYGPINSGNSDDVQYVAFNEGMIGADAAYSLKYADLFISGIPGQMWKKEGDTLEQQTVVDGGVWYPARDIEAYGKNVYVLDPLSKRIWKYEKRAGNEYEKPVLAIDHPEVKDTHLQSLTIDGNIYVLKEGGTILKFTAGQKKDIEIDTNLSTISTESSIMTTVNSTNLYLFDSQGKRLIKFKKRLTGLSSDKEYVLPAVYKGIYILSNERQVYFYDDSKVYVLDL